MDNHTHFLVQVDDVEELSKIMKSVNIKYSFFYNKLMERNGHLFQNRFNSVDIKSERQIYEVLRYIHNNPLFAGLSKSFASYEYSSYRSFFDKEKNNIIDTDFINMVRDNFKNVTYFHDFHNERLFNLQIDTKEDLKLAKKYIMDRVMANKISQEEKCIYANKLLRCGFERRYIADKLNISKNFKIISE